MCLGRSRGIHKVLYLFMPYISHLRCVCWHFPCGVLDRLSIYGSIQKMAFDTSCQNNSTFMHCGNNNAQQHAWQDYKIGGLIFNPCLLSQDAAHLCVYLLRVEWLSLKDRNNNADIYTGVVVTLLLVIQHAPVLVILWVSVQRWCTGGWCRTQVNCVENEFFTWHPKKANLSIAPLIGV